MPCDKCGRPVEPNNDATNLEAIRTGNALYLLMYGARHLFPTEHCEGSPSRAQYLGGPPDTQYELDLELVPAYQEAYAVLTNR